MTGDFSLYVWGSYAMGLALAACELALLHVRARSIRQHLGRRHIARARSLAGGDKASGPETAT